MRRRGFLKALGLGTIAMAAPRNLLGAAKTPNLPDRQAGGKPFDKAQGKPNVLLIFTDD